jgi:hypothetical protein
VDLCTESGLASLPQKSPDAVDNGGNIGVHGDYQSAVTIEDHISRLDASIIEREHDIKQLHDTLTWIEKRETAISNMLRQKIGEQGIDRAMRKKMLQELLPQAHI